MKNLSDSLVENWKEYDKNPLNEDDLFALGMFFFDELGEARAKKIMQGRKNDSAYADFCVALDKLRECSNI